jgi:hypothetical protein
MTETLTPLERAIADAREGRLPIGDLLREFATTPVFIPTATEVSPDGDGFAPLTLDKQGVAMVVCFTTFDRIGDARAAAPYCMQMPGGAFLQMLPRGIGMVVNPGSPVGFDMSPDGLERFLADFGRLA